MDFGDRLTWLLIGCLIGYVIRMLQDIRKGLAEVDEHVLNSHERDEKGIARFELVQRVALGVVVFLAFFASYQSQVAANKSSDTSDKVIEAQADISELQKDMQQNQACTTKTLFATINAINERTSYTTEQADANIELVQAQLDLLVKSRNPELSTAEQTVLFNTYVEQVRKFVRLAKKTKDQQLQFPYPTVEDLSTCLLAEPGDATTPSG